MTDEPDDIEEARERIRKLIDPHRGRDDLSAEQVAKVQAYRNALAVIGGDDRDDADDGPSMDIHMQFVEHESQVAMALLDTSGEETVKLDGASLGGYDLDADEVQRAWEEAVLQKADYIRAKRRGWASSPTDSLRPEDMPDLGREPLPDRDKDNE